MKLVLAIISVFISAPLEAGIATASKAPLEVREVVKRFKAPMLDCPQKIWPNYSWKNFQVVLAYPSQAESWLWTGSDLSLNSLPNETLPSEALTNYYAHFSLNSKPTTSVNMESEDEPFDLVVHEFFHDQAQSGEDVRGLRGTEFPIEVEPRIFREMLKRRLLEALQAQTQQEKDEKLKLAAFWFQAWKSKYPMEYGSATDSYEGSATYVELMASAIANHDCDASDDLLRQELAKKFSERNSHGIYDLMLDSEGYEVGGIASTLVRMTGDLKWYQAVSDGKLPTEILLNRVMPMEDVADPRAVEDITKTADDINGRLANEIGQDIDNFGKPDYVRVGFSMNALQSNFMPTGMYLSDKAPDAIISALLTEHHFASDLEDVRASPGAVFMNLFFEEAPCTNHVDQALIYTLVKKSDIKIEGSKLFLNTERLSGHVSGKLVTANGFSYFCSGR